jgi:hypothetical protein
VTNSKGKHVKYNAGHKPSEWRKDIRDELKAADDEKKAQKAETKKIVVDQEGWEVVTKGGKGPRF